MIPAPTGARSRPKRVRILVGSMATVAIAAVALSAVSAAGSVSVDHSISEEVAMTVTHFGPAILESGKAINVSATIKNSSLGELTALTVALGVTEDPIEDRSSLDPWLAGTLNLATRDVATGPVGAGSLESLGSATVNVVAPSSVVDFPSSSWGVYGVTLTLASAGQPLSTTYALVTWRDADVAAVPVSVVVLAAGTPERIDALMSTADRAGVTIAVDPSSVAETTVAAHGASAGYVLPTGNVDLSSLARAESFDLLDWAIADARDNAPKAVDALPWLAVVPTLDTATFAMATERGAGAILALSTPGAAVESGMSIVAGDVTATPVLVADGGLSTALESGPAGNPLAPARVVAESALAARDHSDGSPLVVVAGPAWSVEADHTSATLDALLASPWVDPITVEEAFVASSPRSLTLAQPSAATGDVPPSVVTSANLAVRALRALAESSSDPEVVLGSAPRDLADAFSLDKRADVVARDGAIDVAVDAIDATMSGIHIADGSTLTLISRSGNVPVTVENDLDVDVTVVVVLETQSRTLHVKASPTITVAARSSQQVLVPVTAVSSANVIVKVSLMAVTGERLTAVTQVHMRIRAAWGDVFTWVLASLTALLLIAGTLRTIRRGPSDARTRPSEGLDSGNNG